jgi:hypothetical protein
MFPFLILVSFGLIACEEERRLDSSACFSLDYNRYQLGKFIFDTPPGLSVFSQSDGEYSRNKREAFVSISRLKDSVKLYKSAEETGKKIVSECQLKDKVPYDAGSRMDFSYKQDQEDGELLIERKDKALIGIWQSTFSIALHEPANKNYGGIENFGVFKISELSALRVKSDKQDVDGSGKPDPISSIVVFELDGRHQSVSCSRLDCTQLVLKDEDDLIYYVKPRRYVAKIKITQQNKKNPENFEIAAAEDLPETVIPVLNFARSLRNRAAEKDMK